MTKNNFLKKCTTRFNVVIFLLISEDSPNLALHSDPISDRADLYIFHNLEMDAASNFALRNRLLLRTRLAHMTLGLENQSATVL